MVNSNIGPNSAPLRDIRLWNLCDIDFDLSWSIKVKSDGVIGLPIYGFLLMVSNVGPNLAPLRDTRVWNPSDLNFDFSRNVEVKCDVGIGLAIYMYGLLLTVNSNIEPNSIPLRDTRLWNTNDVDFDLSRSLKEKSYDVIGFGIYGFLLMVNSSIGLNLAPLRDV